MVKNMTTKKSAVILLCAVIGLFLTACSPKDKSEKNDTNASNVIVSQQKTIVVNLYPIEFLAKSIAKDKTKIINIVKYGIEPHEFELSLNDRKTIEEGSGFIRIGAGMDGWVDKLSIQNILDLSKSVELRKNGNDLDPHYWSGIGNLVKMNSAIAEFLAKQDPVNAQFYKQNADEQAKKLSQIDEKYRSTLAGCGKKKVVVTHEAYEYIAGRYGFETISVLGVEPEEEPSLAKLKEIKSAMKKEGLKVVFLERIVSSKVPQLIAKETGASVKPLYSLENLDEQDAKNGVDLIKMLDDNLVNLKVALECK